MNDNNYVTLIYTSTPANKSFYLDPDTNTPVKKAPKRTLEAGKAKTVYVPSLKHLQSLLKSIANDTNVKITLSYVNHPDKDNNPSAYNIITASQLRDKFKIPPSTPITKLYKDKQGQLWGARVKSLLTPSSYFTFDFDEPPGIPDRFKYQSHQERWNAMCDFIPPLNGVSYLLVPSNSSRVLYNGLQVSKSNAHVYMHAQLANDIARFGHSAGILAFSRGYGYLRDITNGHAKATIFDLCTFSHEREVFEGCPLISRDFTLAPYTSTLYEIPDNPIELLNTMQLPMPTKEEQKTAGMEVVKTRSLVNGNSTIRVSDYQSMTLDTMFVTKTLGTNTLRELTKVWQEGKLRTQSPFRPESVSWASLLQKTQSNEIMCFDSGSGIHYYINHQPDDMFANVPGYKSPSQITPIAATDEDQHYHSLQARIDAMATIAPNTDEYTDKLDALLIDIHNCNSNRRPAFMTALAIATDNTETALKKAMKGVIQSNVQAITRTNNRPPILERCVVLEGDKGGFYDLYLKTYQTTQTMNASNTVLFPTEAPSFPSTLVTTSADRLTASGIGWEPTNNQFFTALGGRQWVNTYHQKQIHPQPLESEPSPTRWLQIVEHICGEHAHIVIQHMAFTLRYPAEKIRWQILIHGGARTGKSMMLEPFKWFFEDACNVVTSDEFKEGWGDMYAQAKVIIMEEVKDLSLSEFNSLKVKFANEDYESLNKKGGAKITQKNLLSMYLLSNENDCVRFTEGQKKLFVIASPHKYVNGNDCETGRSSPNEITTYTTLAKSMKTDEYMNSIMYYLNNVNLDKFSLSALPYQTTAETDMIEASRPDYERRLNALIEEEEGVFKYGIFRITKLDDQLAVARIRIGYKKLSKLLIAAGYKNILLTPPNVKGRKKIWTNHVVLFDLQPRQAWDYVHNLPAEIKLTLLN